MEQYDLIIRGGTVIDPGQAITGAPMDVAVRGGTIAALAPRIDGPAARELDARGLYVTPGLIDLHTHIYPGVAALSVEGDPAALQSGVTTLVDCGTAGAATFEGLRRYVIAPSRCRVLAAVNISVIGLTEMPEGGYTPFLDSNRAHQCIEENRDVAVAVKVRASRNALGDNGTMEAVWMAREAAECAGVPVIAHLGEPPPAYEQILDALRPGDILTHCFRRGPMHCPIDRNGVAREAVLAARRRGVLFDVGHGAGSFSWHTAKCMTAQGFFPDTLSTDLHQGSAPPPVSISMPGVMSRMLHLGMDLPAVVAAATWAPARAIGWADRIGSLKPGMAADVALIRLEEGDFTLYDSHHVPERVNRRLTAVWTIVGGHPVACSREEA